MRERILEIIAEQVNRSVDELDPSMDFIDDLNMDSIELVELIMSVEDEFDIEIDEDRLEKVRSIGDVLDLLEEFDLD
ncbi:MULTISPECIES: acyl carrier protein [Aedoeadaptatus]|uniref:Acyl carrier protein n=1 Tax=Aedoeadaptatus acetigenes TaxID=2981723 RepID=A0ABV1J4P5_9FIRM|nr:MULTISPECIES: acyl carrier protein [Peptoniphilaceae]MBS6524574.1 acyl carrier protein [Peptoniphilaceae bacterium]MCU6786429.1 acyl carrier protein [Aedoeadaptatus acetigenes]